MMPSCTRPSRATAFVEPPLQDPSPTFERDAWEAAVPTITGDQVIQSVNALSAEWKRNQLEQAEKRAHGETPKKETQQPKDTKKALRESNEQIYAFVKKQTGVATPRDFLWSLRRVRILTDPIPIMGEGEIFQLEEGQFYKLEPFNRDGVPVRKPGEEGDAVDARIPFGQAIKRKNNRLELYLDTISCARSLYINGQFCSFPGKGVSQPCYIFKEGDVVCEAQRYLFTVGKNGAIIYPDTKRHSFPISEEAASQTKTFVAQLGYKREKSDPNHLRFTDNLQAAEIGMDEPIRPGFSFYSTLKTGRTNSSEEVDITHSQDDKGDLVFIDIPRDRILQDLVTYLRTEFDLMKYTPEQKMMRLASISADLLSADVWSYRMEKNYLLGDVLQAGAGVCRHRALLIKTLADQLEMPCALVAGPVNRPMPLYCNGQFLGFMEMISIAGQPVAAHAWNIMHLNGRYWVVDAMQQQVFPVDEPPGESSEHRERISGWYGIKPLQQALVLI
jgi:Ethylene-responsive protein kinase Le-CTR1